MAVATTVSMASSFRFLRSPTMFIKLNTDGFFIGRDSSRGAELMTRDSDGLFIFIGASCYLDVHPLYSELWTKRLALTETTKAAFRTLSWRATCSRSSSRSASGCGTATISEPRSLRPSTESSDSADEGSDQPSSKTFTVESVRLDEPNV
uniref:Uncharacterized protein n=1 Tax=Ananas comosus var. bracteatus TaxID=296719 RepID=A0A6V7Q8X9_ANACO|nr:unnamed protein product [Ananas comosus var. bracteatus]